MALRFHHTIVPVRDKRAGATFLAEVLGAPAAVPFGPFMAVQLEGSASIDVVDHPSGDIPSFHPAFLVDEEDVDAIHARILERGIRHWADPHGQHPDEINTHDGGRGVDLQDPDGHFYEAITVPYGGW